MVAAVVEKTDEFVRTIQKLKDGLTKERVAKQIQKIINNPEAGKPMRYSRKGTREVYISPFRLSYIFVKEENKIIFLDLYHKNEQ